MPDEVLYPQNDEVEKWLLEAKEKFEKRYGKKE
jgi:hypothetical protein